MLHMQQSLSLNNCSKNKLAIVWELGPSSVTFMDNWFRMSLVTQPLHGVSFITFRGARVMSFQPSYKQVCGASSRRHLKTKFSEFMPMQMVPRQGDNWYASLWTWLICSFLDKVHQHYCQGEPNFRHTPMSTSRCICLLQGMGQSSCFNPLVKQAVMSSSETDSGFMPLVKQPCLTMKQVPDSCLLSNRQLYLALKQVPVSFLSNSQPYFVLKQVPDSRLLWNRQSCLMLKQTGRGV